MITSGKSGKGNLSINNGRGKDLQLNVARIGDIPYWESPPMQFSFTEKVDLVLGTYPMIAGRTPMINVKNLNESTLIYFYDMTFSADIPGLEYQKSLQLITGDTSIPNFNMFFQDNRNAPALQDPILLQNYFTAQDYQLLVEPKQTPNTLNAFFRGTLQQTAALAGVQSINMTFTFYAQQIVDDNYIQAFKQGYPKAPPQGGRF